MSPGIVPPSTAAIKANSAGTPNAQAFNFRRWPDSLDEDVETKQEGANMYKMAININ